MRQVNLHEAKTHLSRLVAEAVAGEGFVICKAGKPLVRVTRLEGDHDPAPPRRRGAGSPGAVLVALRRRMTEAVARTATMSQPSISMPATTSPTSGAMASVAATSLSGPGCSAIISSKVHPPHSRERRECVVEDRCASRLRQPALER